MNIFLVNTDPELAAYELPLEYIHKMPLETAQMLMTFIRLHNAKLNPFMDVMRYCKTCYHNHPCQMWLAESSKNFEWLVNHGLTLCYLFEQENEFDHQHANKRDILFAQKWLKDNKRYLDLYFDHTNILTLPLCAWGDKAAKVDIYAGLKRTYCTPEVVLDIDEKPHDCHRAKSLHAAVVGYKQYVCMKVFKPVTKEDIAAKNGRLPTWRNNAPPDWYRFCGNLRKYQ